MRRLFLLLIVLSLPRQAHADDYLLQVGWDVRARDFYGLFQLGLHTTRSDEVVSLLQWSLWRNRASDTATLLQLAPVNRSGSFYGLLQVGMANRIDHEMYGLAQLGMINTVRHRFYLGMQLGAANFLEGRARMTGLGQIGLYNNVGRELIALFQVGVVNWSDDGFVGAILQAGLYNRADQFGGLFQVAVVNDVLDEAYCVQLGVANFARRITGVQIGLFNAARTLHGVQIGLLNIARHDAILPITLLLNVGW